jgi:RNA recognition motif-containing protein
MKMANNSNTAILIVLLVICIFTQHLLVSDGFAGLLFSKTLVFPSSNRYAIKQYREIKFYESVQSKLYQSTSTQPNGKNLVFIGNLPFDVNEEDLNNLSNDLVGENLLRSVLIPRGKKSKRGLGYAFFDYISAEVAAKAVQLYDGLIYDERPLNSNLKDENEISSKKKKRDESNSIFLTNLDFTLTEEELSNMCDDIVGPGLVVSIERPLDKVSGQRRSFAFIEFVDTQSKERAIQELNNLEVLGRLLSCAELTRPTVRRIV